MEKILQDIYILSENGITVFHRVFDEKLDEQLFGALLSAINSFAEELAKGGLSSFELKDKRFTIIKRNHFLFIASSSKAIKPKKASEELENIIGKFFNIYKADILINWDGDISIFSNFEKQIETSLEETIKKFQKAFW